METKEIEPSQLKKTTHSLENLPHNEMVNEEIKVNEKVKVVVPITNNESPLKKKESKSNDDINKRKTSICDDNPPKANNSNNNKTNNNNLQYVDPTFYNEFFFNSEIL